MRAVASAKVRASKLTVQESQERGIENGELGMGRRERRREMRAWSKGREGEGEGREFLKKEEKRKKVGIKIS